ncbi:MAG: PHP domain-containing protein, partial [Planktomarina sp.]
MFVELSATSNFSFLKGASHPEEYIARAALLGMPALAIADENSVAGIVRAHSEARNIARRVAARQAAPEYGPPRPAHIAPPPSADVTNIPRLIPAAQLI